MTTSMTDSVPGASGVADDPGAVHGALTGAGALAARAGAVGRPRSAKADEAIVEAVLNMMAEGTTIEALSMEAVAQRAGVGKATIYRRWANKEDLVVDAIAKVKGAAPVELTGENLRDDLLALVRPFVAMKSTRAGQIMPCLIPELRRNPELQRRYHQLAEPRRELMRQVLRRGIASGELRADLDVDAVCVMLAGPMVAQTVLNWNPDLDVTKLPEQIVDTLLPGIRA